MGSGKRWIQFTVRCLLNLPVYVLCAIIAWSYYTVTFVICAGRVPQYIPNNLLIVPYHISAFLFLWSFWCCVRTSILAIPRRYCLSATETVKFIELDTDYARDAYLEQLVEHKSIPITLNNKRGTVPFCDICFLIKPDRTHHCSSCEKCVPKMDHHCPWINNCVGYHNQKYFLLFLFHAVWYCVLCFLSTLGFFIEFTHNPSDISLDGLQVFFLFVISAVFAIAVFAFLSFQLTLLFRNSSTLEHCRTPKFRDPTVHGSFNLGWKANFIQVFGPWPSLWCFPVFSSQGNGLSFPIKTICQDDMSAPLLHAV